MMYKKDLELPVKSSALTLICLGAIVLGFSCGVLLMNGTSNTLIPEDLKHGYALTIFGGGISTSEILNAFLLQFFPLLFIYFSGYGYLTVPCCGVVLLLRSILCGYACTALLAISETERLLSVLLYVGFVLFEAAITLLLVSFSRAALSYQYSCIDRNIPPLKNRLTLYYTFDFFFSTGVLLILFFLRSCFCRML